MRFLTRLPSLAVAALLAVTVFAHGLLAQMGPAPSPPASVRKYVLMDSVAAIDATTLDSTVYDTNGWEDVTFTFLSTLNTGFSTGSVFFKGQIYGCDTPDGTFSLVPGCETAELVVDVGQTVPSAANAPGVRLPRFLKVRWAETGAMTSFTGTCTARFNRPKRGKQHDFNEVGG